MIYGYAHRILALCSAPQSASGSVRTQRVLWDSGQSRRRRATRQVPLPPDLGGKSAARHLTCDSGIEGTPPESGLGGFWRARERTATLRVCADRSPPSLGVGGLNVSIPPVFLSLAMGFRAIGARIRARIRAQRSVSSVLASVNSRAIRADIREQLPWRLP
jgi:hypothetical protein